MDTINNDWHKCVSFSCLDCILDIMPISGVSQLLPAMLPFWELVFPVLGPLAAGCMVYVLFMHVYGIVSQLTQPKLQWGGVDQLKLFVICILHSTLYITRLSSAQTKLTYICKGKHIQKHTLVSSHIAHVHWLTITISREFGDSSPSQVMVQNLTKCLNHYCKDRTQMFLLPIYGQTDITGTW